MAIEQIIVLLLFVVVPLIQALLRRGSQEPDEVEQPPVFTLPPPPASTMPRPPLGSRARASPLPRPTVAAPGLPSSVSARPLPALGSRERARSRHVRDLLPRDVRGLRRALVVADVLGAPRALKGP